MKKIISLVQSRMDPNLVRLSGYLKPHWRKILCAVFCMVLAGASSSWVALLLGKLTDLGFYNHDPLIIVAAPVGLIFISMLHGGSMFMSNYLLAKVSQSILRVLRTQLYHNILRWPAETYQRNPTGLIASKFINEANIALSNAAKSSVILIRDSLQVFCLTFVLLYHNWKLAFVAFIVFPLIALLLKYMSSKMNSVVSSSQQNVSTLLVGLKETYKAHRLVKINNNYRRESERFSRLNNTIKDVMVRMSRYSSLGNPLSQVIGMSAVAIVIAIALIQAQAGLLTMGEFVTFLTAMLLLLPPLRQLVGQNTAFIGIKMASASIFTTLDEAVEADEGAVELSNVKGCVDFEAVGLKYPNTDCWAVKDFTLHVKAGEHVALVGLSGAGKTSLVHMLPRFWNPTSGKILIDGIDTKECTLESLRRQMAIVSQDVKIFEGTIRDNIIYGLDVSETDLKLAIEASALTDFVDSLPYGLETQVGEAGDRLSGGQRQRISIARALLRNAPILIMDEATSALDSESEQKIKVALEKLMCGRTTFIVAHRFSTIDGVDLIVAMEDGVIKEVGSHHELMKIGGLYKRLRGLQSLSETEE